MTIELRVGMKFRHCDDDLGQWWIDSVDNSWVHISYPSGEKDIAVADVFNWIEQGWWVPVRPESELTISEWVSQYDA